MFQSLPNLTLRSLAALLVVSVVGIVCAQAKASCGNYLHTRNGGPQEMVHNLPSGPFRAVQGPAQNLRQTLTQSMAVPVKQPTVPVAPCSGPFCRQSPDGPAGAVLDSVHSNSLLKLAAGTGGAVLPSALAGARRGAAHGTAKLQAGFPPGIDIPPEPMSC